MITLMSWSPQMRLSLFHLSLASCGEQGRESDDVALYISPDSTASLSVRTKLRMRGDLRASFSDTLLPSMLLRSDVEPRTSYMQRSWRMLALSSMNRFSNTLSCSFIWTCRRKTPGPNYLMSVARSHTYNNIFYLLSNPSAPVDRQQDLITWCLFPEPTDIITDFTYYQIHLNL